MASLEQLALASTIVAIPILWRLGGAALRRYFTSRYTVAYDIPQVALEREEGERIKGTAVICGGRYAICLLPSSFLLIFPQRRRASVSTYLRKSLRGRPHYRA